MATCPLAITIYHAIFSYLGCPYCKARVEMKPPRSVVLGLLIAPPFCALPACREACGREMTPDVHRWFPAIWTILSGRKQEKSKGAAA